MGADNAFAAYDHGWKFGFFNLKQLASWFKLHEIEFVRRVLGCRVVRVWGIVKSFSDKQVIFEDIDPRKDRRPCAATNSCDALRMMDGVRYAEE